MVRLEDATPHTMTVAQYMGLDIDDRTELIGGVVYDMSPPNMPHRHAVRVLARRLILGLAESYEVETENAVAIDGSNGIDAPEVDVAILRRRRYDTIPTAADAVALVEVSDSTYRDDRRTKMPLYVGAGVQTWIVNIPARRVERYEANDDGTIFGPGEEIEIVGVRIAVTDLLLD